MVDVNTDVLLALIEERPVIWDKTLTAYKAKNETKKAWTEIFIELRSDFEQCAATEKNDFAQAVMKRWINVRDSFKKSFKKQKENAKSGAGANSGKPYIYNNQLQFLLKIFEERQTEDSLTPNVTEAGVANTEQIENTNENIPESAKEARQGSRKRKLDPVEIEMINVLKEKPDRHLSFFKGIIPSLSSFDEDEIIEFQMGVLSTITSIKQRRNMGSRSVVSSQQETPPSGSQHYATCVRQCAHFLIPGFNRPPVTIAPVYPTMDR